MPPGGSQEPPAFPSLPLGPCPDLVLRRPGPRAFSFSFLNFLHSAGAWGSGRTSERKRVQGLGLTSVGRVRPHSGPTLTPPPTSWPGRGSDVGPWEVGRWACAPAGWKCLEPSRRGRTALPPPSLAGCGGGHGLCSGRIGTPRDTSTTPEMVPFNQEHGVFPKQKLTLGPALRKES